MPIRRIHFTGRKRLRSTDVEIKLDDEVIPPTFKITKLDLYSYGFPSEANVYVESYRQTSYMRFPCGTVGQLTIPSNFSLDEFDSPDAIRFRVKVTSATHPTKGQLLAELNGIADKSVDSLLPVKPDSNLDQEVFRVDFSAEPVLLINAKAVAWKEVASNPVFRSLVYPTVLRTILTRILFVEEYVATDDQDDWRSQWVTFAKTHLGSPDPPENTSDQDQINEWIDDAVGVFSKREKAYDVFARHYATEE